MKKTSYFLIFLLAVLIISCKSLGIKYYVPMTDSGVIQVTNQKKNLLPIPLKNYTFYKQERYYNDKLGTFYKGPLRKIGDSFNVRYEMQVMLVEQNNENSKQVIYFSCYPPYKYKGKYIYDYSFYDNFNIFNIHAVNFIMFGVLDSAMGTITWEKDGHSVIYYLNSNSIDKQYQITDVKFKLGCKEVTKSTSEYLNNVPEYKKMDNPQIVLQQYPDDPLDRCTTDFVKGDILYYDKINNEIYFEFTEPLDRIDNTWIKFESNRIQAKKGSSSNK